MDIVIIGAGSVGFSLAEYLSDRKHHITLIEQNPDLCNNISSKLDVFTIIGSGTNPSILEKADIKNAHMVIAVTPSDDSNLLCCNLAKQFGVEKRMARIKSTDYSNSPISLQDLGVTHVIEPEKEIVNSIMQYIKLPGVTEAANFQSDNVYLRGYRISEDMPIANKTLLEITEIAPNPELDSSAQILVVLIIRDGKTIMPTGAEHIYPGDEVIAIMPNESLETFRKLLNKNEDKLKKIVIFGDSLTAIHLAEELEPLCERIILVDPDEQHGRTAASLLDKTEVLFGDCTDVDMLQEINIKDTPFFIAVGADSEDNIMSCLLAKAEGAKEVIALTTNERHTGLFQSLGIDRIINPRKLTAQKIIENIIKVPISTLHSIKNADIEVSRFIVGKKSSITGKPLRNIANLYSKSIIIGCVFHNDEVIIPSGQTIINEKDEALVICPPKNLKLASKLFKPNIKFVE